MQKFFNEALMIILTILITVAVLTFTVGGFDTTFMQRFILGFFISGHSYSAMKSCIKIYKYETRRK